MNNEHEFDPTNQEDPNYDSTLHNQHEEAQSQTPPPVAPKKVTTEERYKFLTPEERLALKALSVPGMRDAPTQGLSLTDEQLLVKEKLAKEPRVTMFVPLDPGEKAGDAYRSVTINGYRSEVKKGKMVKLPESIATLLMQAYEIEAETLNNNEFNLSNASESKRSALNA